MTTPIILTKCLTVRKLKEIIKDWPEEDKDGAETEVWIETSPFMSSEVLEIWPLDVRGEVGDILLIPKRKETK